MPGSGGTADAQIVRRVTLSEHHAPTGAVAHYRGIVTTELAVDIDRSNPIPAPAALLIVRFGETAFNLVHLDAGGAELTDTFHESLDDALDQGLREFRVRPDEWEVVSEPY